MKSNPFPGCMATLALVAAQPVHAEPAIRSTTLPDTVSDLAYKCPGAVQLHVISKDDESSLARGTREHELDLDTTFRIASNTKPFVAATVIRLSEEGRISLDDPILALVSPRLATTLAEDGYDLEQITVRHLLTHRSGLYDHASDPRFFASFKSTPQRRWQRAALVRKAVEWGDPVGAPGERFSYSDTGYLLLGDLIERVTGTSLASAVREKTGFAEASMRSSWWEHVEDQPGAAGPRSAQVIEGHDYSAIHPSMDLFGGGGLVMPMRDLARGFRRIASGESFMGEASLAQLLRPVAGPEEPDYRAGVFVEPHGTLWHSGFWGTVVAYQPHTRTTIAAAVVDRADFSCFRSAILDNLEGSAQ